MTSPRRPLSRPKKLAFAAGLLLCGLLLGEGGARLLVGPEPAIYLDHPYLRRVRAPDSSHELISPLPPRERFTLHVDGQGFRARGLEPPGTPKTPGTYRIFFVGASAVENVAVPDERTFEALVEAELNARLGGRPRVVVVNAGLSGNVVADTFSLVAHRVLALEPDLVVEMDGLNDMIQATSSRFDPAHYVERIEPRAPRPGEVLRAWSRLADLIARAADRLGTEDRYERWRRRRRERPFSQGVDSTRGLAYYQRYLALLSAACAEAKVPLALMTHPSLWKEGMSPEEDAALWMGWVNHGELNLDTPTLRAGIAAFNQAVREHAVARGHRLIDLDAAVPRDLEHFYDDCHFTVRGNEAAARAIVDALLAGGGLP